MMAPPPERRSGVNGSLTAKRRTRVTENDEYAAFLRRAIAAYSRRVASGDIDALADMTRLADTSIRPSPRPSPACAPARATPGPTSPCGSASAARPPSNDGAPPPVTTTTTTAPASPGAARDPARPDAGSRTRT